MIKHLNSFNPYWSPQMWHQLSSPEPEMMTIRNYPYNMKKQAPSNKSLGIKFDRSSTNTGPMFLTKGTLCGVMNPEHHFDIE